MLRIADPVVEPGVGRLAADALQRLAKRAARTDGRAIVLIDDVASEAPDRAHDLLTRLRVSARRRRNRRRVGVAVREEIGDGRVDLRLVARMIGGRIAVRVVPDLRHPGDVLDRGRIAHPVLHPVLSELAVDLRQDRSRLAKVLEALRLVARVAARALECRVRNGELRRVRDVNLLPVTLHARRFRHVRRQHRVVPHVRLVPVVLLFPLLTLLRVARIVRRVVEAGRSAESLMTHSAAGGRQRMRRVAADIGGQVRVRAERLRILLVAAAIDRQVARRAPIHLHHAREVHIVDDVRRDDLADRQRRRHEVEQRRVEEVILDEARLDVGDDAVQTVLLEVDLVNLLLQPADLGRVLAELGLYRRALGRDLFNFEIHLAQPLRFRFDLFLLLADTLRDSSSASASNAYRLTS